MLRRLRRLRRRTLPLLGLASLLAAGGVAACGSSGDGGASGGSPAGPSGSDGSATSEGGASTEPDGASGSDGGGADAATAADGASTSDGGSSDGSSGDGASDGGPVVDAGADAAVNDDPFDPASCGGNVLTSGDALAALGASPRVKLADATLMRRTRVCAGPTADTCGPWGAPTPHTQPLLTYSGGVVTDYKTFSFPTHLVLFSAAGQPKLSIRHTSDYLHDATASTRGVVFAFGADPMVNTYPIIYVWDFAPAPNRYDDLQGLLGDDGFLHAREHCARVVFPKGVTTEIAALYRY